MNIRGKNYILASQSPEYWSKWDSEDIINKIFQCSVGKIEFSQQNWSVLSWTHPEVVFCLFVCFSISNQDLQCAYPHVHRFLVKVICISQNAWVRRTVKANLFQLNLFIFSVQLKSLKFQRQKCIKTWVDDTLQTDLSKKDAIW